MTYDKASERLTVVCEYCGRSVEIPCTQKQYREYMNRTKLIQDIFPKVPAGDREALITGMCGECFDKMFEELEDECDDSD